MRAIANGDHLSVMRRLKLMQTYTKRSQKRASSVYRSNYNYLHSKYY
jgi:hypothetical protein